MAGLVLRRLVQFGIVAWLVATLLFFAIRATGDPAALILGPRASLEQIEGLRETLGLNEPLHAQYGDFLFRLLPRYDEGSWSFLDFGRSLRTPEPAMDLVLDRLPATLALGATAFGIILVLSIPLGVLLALWDRKPAGKIVGVIVLLGQVTPTFVLGLSLILVFGVFLGVLPVFGFEGPASLILPGVTLAAFPLAQQVRLLRAQMLEVGSQDFIRTARAKGLASRTVLGRHQLRNALLPWLSLLGLNFGVLMGGSIIVEVIVAWPGIGAQLITAINQRDFPVVQAIVFLIGLLVVFGNLVVDIAYRLLDPRMRYVG